MTVQKLIDKLKEFPPELDVEYDPQSIEIYERTPIHDAVGATVNIWNILETEVVANQYLVILI